MAIITISRGTFAGGERMAELLTATLGYRVVSREQLHQRVSETYGFSEVEIEEITEQAADPLELGDARCRFTVGQRRRQLVFALRASLCELLQVDDAIYHGQVGHLLLRGISHVLRVRLIAPRGLRITMAMEREGIGRLEAAERVARADAERRRWTLSLFGVDWEDPAIFDGVLNLERMSIDEAAELTAAAARQPSFRTTDGSRRAMDNLRLASQMMARLLAHSGTAHLNVAVQVDAGAVSVFGRLSADDLQRVREVAGLVAGVREVRAAEC